MSDRDHIIVEHAGLDGARILLEEDRPGRIQLMQSRDRIKAILIAPDRKTIKLAAPAAGEAVIATVTFSEKIGGAVLVARSLPKYCAGKILWWPPW